MRCRSARRLRKRARKRAQIQEKGEQVSALRANVERELEHQRFEDAQLAEKQEQTQEKIASESGDYRAVEALTKELEGFAQRRTALAEKIGGLKTRKAQVDQVAAQVDAALAAINAQEQKAVESFQQEGGALTEAIARAQAAREDLAGKSGLRHPCSLREDRAAPCGRRHLRAWKASGARHAAIR